MSVRMKLVLFAPMVAAVALLGWRVHAQTGVPATNDAPNPYTTIKDFFKLPEGRVWGSTSAVDIDKDGHSVWIAERCGANSCVADPANGKLSTIDPILHYEASGKLIKAFGAGLFSAPHGIFVDRDGKVMSFIPDPDENATGTSAAEGVAADSRGNVYGAEVGPRQVKKHVKK